MTNAIGELLAALVSFVGESVQKALLFLQILLQIDEPVFIDVLVIEFHVGDLCFRVVHRALYLNDNAHVSRLEIDVQRIRAVLLRAKRKLLNAHRLIRAR